MKRTCTIILLLLTAVTMSLYGAKTIYATLDKKTHTFCIYYDEYREGRPYVCKEWNWVEGTKNVPQEDLKEIYSVDFDESMKEITPFKTEQWFANMTKLKTINHLEYFETTLSTTMDKLFYNCKSLIYLDLTPLNVKNVLTMNSMFEGCEKLAVLDISSFNLHAPSITVKGVSCNRMFARCRNLRVIFSPEKPMFGEDVENYPGKEMFLDCKYLTGGNGTKYDPEHIDSSYGTYDSEGHPGYFTSVEESENPKLYVTLSADSTTLTLRYDKELGPNRGMAEWAFYNNYAYNPSGSWFAIEKIIVDGSVVTATPKSTSKFFYCFEHLKEIENLSYLNTMKAEDMSYMFAGCKSLTNLDLSTFMTSDATNMAGMFHQCQALEKLDISSLSTSNVTDMSYMFAECPKLKNLDLTSFNTANVTNMAGMFKKCEALKELNFPAVSFNTENVTDMSEMFSGCHSLQSLYLRYFKTGQVTTMKGMFESCRDLKEVDISSFDFSQVKDVSQMFFIAPNLETIYCNSDLSQMPNIAESENIFGGCLKLVGGAGTSYMAAGGGGIAYARPDDEENPGFFTSTIESKTAEVYGKRSEDGKTLTIYYDKRRPIVGGRKDWSVYNNNPLNEKAETNRVTKVVIDESVKNAKPKTTEAWFANFRYLKTITNLDYLNTSEVTSMKEMFMHCDSLVDMSVSSFDTKNVTDMSGMFKQCGKLRKLDVSKFNTSNVTDMSHMFSECKNVMALKLDNFDTRNVTNMAYMFYNCVYAFPLKVSNFDTQNVTDMSYMFAGCKYETSIDVSHFNTSNVTNMEGMFSECKNLGALDLCSFDVSKVTNMKGMFTNDISLYYLYANKDWSAIAPLEESDFMFSGCTNLRGNAGTFYDKEHTDATYARPDEGEGNPGYFTAVAEIYATWDAGTTTLTLRYDSRREENGGTSNWALYNNVATKVVLDETMKKAEPESTKDWFYSFSLLEEIEHLDYLSTYSVKDMSYMFAGCSSLSVLNVNSFYLSWAETTEGMFSYCLNLKTIWCDHNWHEQLYNKNSKDMFLGCTSLIGGKGTAYDANYVNSSRACTDSNLRYGYFTAIPEGAEDLSGNELYAVLESDNKTLTIRYDKDRLKNGGVTDWYPYSSKADTYQVETVVFDPSVADARPKSTEDWFRWFNDLTSVTGLEYLNTENVTDMNAMFADCSSLTALDVTHFNTQNVTNMGFMFSNCTSLKALDLSHFDTRKVSILYNMFENCESLTELDIRQFETNEVTDMTMLFAGCKALTALDVTALKTGKVTDMMGMFYNCEQLTTLDVSGFDMSSITSLIGMFYGCKSLKTIYCNDDWSKLPSLVYHDDMFTECTELVGGNNTAYSADNANDVSFAHVGTAGKPGYFTTNITHQVTLTAENGKIEVAEKEIDLAVVPEGTVLHLTAIPDNGYLLDAWTGYNGTELVVNEDKEVVANFAVQTFTVTFKDWNDELIDQQVVEWGKSAVAPEDPVREDYLFMGWDPSDFSTVYEDMTVQAQYEFLIKYYTVTLVTENGKIAVEEDIDLTSVENGTLLHLTATPEYGYTFDHWENYDPESGLVVNGDITVTAYFSPMLFTLTVVAEPAEGGTFILSGVDMNNQATYMTDYYIEAVPNEGYEFVEWRDGDEVLDNKTPEMSGALYGDITIVGVFKVKINMYTVTYYDWNGDKLFVEQVEEGKDAKGPENDPEREGYTFTGWDKPLTNITADLSVQALYEENKVYFTVTYYDWNGDEIFVEQVEEGKDAKGPDSDPEREGYTFTGWNKSLENITSDLFVVAQYKKNPGTGVEDVQRDEVQCTKLLRDGQIIIIRDGNIYSVQGQRLIW